MSEKTKSGINFTKNHYGKWVALTSDKAKIVSYSSDLEALRKKVGKRKVIYTKALDPQKTYAF